ncbi:uncharacterized protein P884DRAFT_270390 [Thermothelomyces heterothallicus CBS 202.75]|uniref:uncharacterized protein n=1 Tax=Thermothelomyces heterothallicus CBS 202.75 TaxID=1149848 RepID=UPI00374276F0
MDKASDRTRRQRVLGPRLPNLALIAGLFINASSPIAPAGAAAAAVAARQCLQAPAAPAAPRSPRSLPSPLQVRSEGEHVVLADCVDTAGVLSSQIAYFPGDPGPSPQDVAVVQTEEGQTALWVNDNTSALFTTTGVTFTALIGPHVKDGEFAGIGNNGYGNFSCYQKYSKDLYKYAKTTCSQVYLCDHSAPPAGWVWDPSGSSNSMSHGTIIGIAVGVVGGVLFLLAAALAIWYFRRSRGGRGGAASRLSSKLLRSGTSSTAAASSDAGEPKSQTQTPTPSEFSSSQNHQPVVQKITGPYEMDARYRVELANDNGKYEMDPHGHGSAELDPTPKQNQVSPVTAAQPDSLPQHGGFPPRSPPPQYAE